MAQGFAPIVFSFSLMDLKFVSGMVAWILKADRFLAMGFMQATHFVYSSVLRYAIVFFFAYSGLCLMAIQQMHVVVFSPDTYHCSSTCF